MYRLRLVALACVVLVFGLGASSRLAAEDLIWAHPDQADGTTDDAAAIAAALMANGVIDVTTVEDLPTDLSTFDRVWVVLGTYSGTAVTTNHAMTEAEGQILADFLTLDDGLLYVSGSDHFQFDPPTPLAALDGVEACGTPGMQTPCDGQTHSELQGVDSSTGLDLSSQSATYSGENMFMDHVPPDPANPGAGLIWMDTGTGDPAGVYHDGNVSGLGNFRVIATSFEFGGYGDEAARNEVMALYLAILDPNVAPCGTPPITQPTGVNCAVNGTDVDLTWSNGTNAYDEIRILREGQSVMTLPGDATSFTDPGLAPGVYTYRVQGVNTTPPLCFADSDPCTATFGITDLVWAHPDQADGDTDDEAAILAALAANGLAAGSTGKLPHDLSPFDRVWVVLGTYLDTMTRTKHVMTQAEGQILAEYLTEHEGRLYLSGGDHFFFDPPTALAGLDGVEPLSDGENDVSNPVGQDSGTGLDLTGIMGAYLGENVLMDEIGPDPGTPGAGLIFEDAVSGDPIGVYHDGDLSTLGNFRVISTSFEFGGLSTPQQMDLMEAYLGVFGGVVPSVQFIRGDADGNGAFQGLPDMVFLLGFGFMPGAPEPPCMMAADVDGNRDVNALADGIYGLSAQFMMGSPPPPSPFPNCGEDANGLSILGCVTPDPVCN